MEKFECCIKFKNSSEIVYSMWIILLIFSQTFLLHESNHSAIDCNS